MLLKQVLVGPSGLRSSQIALGGMTFGDQRRWGCTPQEAEEIMAQFVAAGGTTVDTAPNYADGRSEEAIGEFARSRRDELVLSTKYTAASSSHPLAGGNSRRSMIQSVEASLRRLQTDRIDLLWLHFWDFTTPLDEILRAADDLVAAGKILYFGLSDVPAWLASRAVTMALERQISPVIALQLEYNAASRGVERDLLQLAQAMDLGVFCWGPLSAGALACGTEPQRVDEARIGPALRIVRQGLQTLADRTGWSPRHLALQWLLTRDPTCIPIMGARTTPQIRDLLEIVQAPIAAEILDEITTLAVPDPLFPSAMLTSGYLQKFALGQPDALIMPRQPRS